MLIPNPFYLQLVAAALVVRNFLNYLIFHSTDYDKQELAACKSFEDYRSFNEGYVESLLTPQLNQEGVHVYVAKVQPFMEIKTNEGKEHYNLEVRGTNRGSVLQARCKCNLL